VTSEGGGRKARATRAALARQIQATCPEMTSEVVDEVISAVPVRSRARARQYLDEHADALISGDPTAIPSVLLVIKLLADAGSQKYASPPVPAAGEFGPSPIRSRRADLRGLPGLRAVLGVGRGLPAVWEDPTMPRPRRLLRLLLPARGAEEGVHLMRPARLLHRLVPGRQPAPV
jgi:hypothetical protein